MEQKTIMLECEALGAREFELSHAQSLIQYEHKIGKSLWRPVKGSHYTIQDGSLIKCKNTGASDSTKAQQSDSKGSEAGE